MTAAKLIGWSQPRPFKIAVEQADIDRVRAFAELTDYSRHLAHTLEKEPDDIDSYGLPIQQQQALLEHLCTRYDWRVHEAALNAMGEHVKIMLHDYPDEGDFEMHAVVVRSKDPKATPLLAVHGWPGDFSEFRELAPLLAHGTPAFHVVVPSLPGFTFSQAPRVNKITPNSITKCAMAVDAVMRAVFNDDGVKYITQSGDLGSITCRRVSQLFPDRCRGIHLNYASVLPADAQVDERALTADEKRGYSRYQHFRLIASAYQGMNKTVPYTLGNMLASSPLAVVAYMGEKWYRWSAPATQPSLDLVLTHCLLYWFTGSLTSSAWLYRGREPEGDGYPYFVEEDRDVNLHTVAITVPTAFAFGHYEICWMPRKILERFFHRIVSYKVLPRGGHFLAQEEPVLLAGEVREFAKSLGL